MSLFDSFLCWSATTLEAPLGDVHNIDNLAIMQKPHFPDPSLEASVATCQSGSNPCSPREGSDLTLTCRDIGSLCGLAQGRWCRILCVLWAMILALRGLDLPWHILADPWSNSDLGKFEASLTPWTPYHVPRSCSTAVFAVWEGNIVLLRSPLISGSAAAMLGCVPGLQQCLGGWFVSSEICTNAGTTFNPVNFVAGRCIFHANLLSLSPHLVYEIFFYSFFFIQCWHFGIFFIHWMLSL